METQDHPNKSALEAYLDRIIEKHTATPDEDPEIVEYVHRPQRKRPGEDKPSLEHSR